MTWRDDIAAALAGVPGIDPKPHQPNSPHPGECWPRWTRTTWLTDCSTEQTCQVLVVLPAGSPETTAMAADELRAAMFTALSEVAFIDWAEPLAMPAQDGGATIPLLAITIRITD
jgi:hypothetical protein